MAELVRFAYTEDFTLGWLTVGTLKLATIERPWIPSPHHKGGLNRESCVPDGAYTLRRHSGPDFQDVFGLENPALDVNYAELPRAEQSGRWAILIHQGNWVRNVVGCIAVGLAHRMLPDPRRGNQPSQAVTSSVVALNRLRLAFAAELPELVIRPTLGTKEPPT